MHRINFEVCCTVENLPKYETLKGTTKEVW